MSTDCDLILQNYVKNLMNQDNELLQINSKRWCGKLIENESPLIEVKAHKFFEYLEVKFLMIVDQIG